jgi:hypothetical protein
MRRKRPWEEESSFMENQLLYLQYSMKFHFYVSDGRTEGTKKNGKIIELHRIYFREIGFFSV